jgi:hypothetical protein
MTYNAGQTSDALLGATVESSSGSSAVLPNYIYVGTLEPGRLEWLPDGAALILNHKGSGGKYRSVTQFVYEQPEEVFAQWRQALPLGREPASLLAGLTIEVEDASPDTCLAILAFAARAQGRRLPERWLDYINRWEAGDVRSTGEPERSFGALANALTHPPQDAPDGLGMALSLGLGLAEGLLAADADPADILPDLQSKHLAAARSLLEIEHRSYRQTLEAGQILELLAPLPNSHRRRPIDAAILTEIEPQGVIKAWLRKDPRSPSGAGFGLMALYRPSEVGAGNDMTVSLDPSLGLDLYEFWVALEEREEAAWATGGETRPRTNPRRLNTYGSARFKKRAQRSVQPCDQPWYDGGDLTLVAAPRKFAAAAGAPAKLGTRLSWPEVLDTLWAVYRPDHGLKAHSRGNIGAPLPLLDAVAGAAQVIGPPARPLRVSDVVLDRRNVAAPVWTDTLFRAVAGSLRGAPAAIESLPHRDDLDIFKERGGFVVVSAEGVAMLEIAPASGFPAEALRLAAQDQARLLERAHRARAHLDKASDRVGEVLRGHGAPSARRALNEIYRTLADIRDEPRAAGLSSSDPLVRRVGLAMENRWQAQAIIEGVVKRAEDQERLVLALNEVRTADLLRAATIYALPAVVLSPVFAIAFEPMKEDGWPVFLGLAVAPLLATTVLGLASVWFIRRLQRRADRRMASVFRSTSLSLDDPV